MTIYSTLPTINQKKIRITDHKNIHKIYTTNKYISIILNQKLNKQLTNKISNLNNNII
jgi:hypothetical protein